RRSWGYELIFCQQAAFDIYNFPILQRCRNTNAAPEAVVFHQPFDMHTSAWGKYSNDFHVVRGRILRMRRIEMLGNKKVEVMLARVLLQVCERHLDLRFPNRASER